MKLKLATEDNVFRKKAMRWIESNALFMAGDQERTALAAIAEYLANEAGMTLWKHRVGRKYPE